MKNYTVAFFTLWINFCIGQEMTSLKGTLNWKNITSNSTKLNFEGAQYCPQKLGIPILLLQAPINKNAIVNVELRNITTEEITDAPKNYRISEDFKINHGIYTENRQGKIWIEIEALRNNKGRIEKLIDYEIIIQEKQNNLAFSPPPPPFKLTSILSNGDIYKIAVKENGIYKIDKNFLEKNLKLNLSGIDPRKISIYGNGGDKLPELNATNRIDDLEELAIYISGENDGSFDANDQILFYANGPDLLTYNLATQDFDFTKNIYSEWSYYFIKINTQNGKRISQKNKITGSFPLSNKSLQCIHYEKDLVNLLEYNTCNHGTGQRWAGESIGITRPFESMDLFRFPNIVMGSDIKLTGYYVARAGGNSLLDISLNSSGMQKTVYGVDLDICTNPTASGVDFSLSSKATTELVSVKLQPKISSSISHESWIDFIQVSATTLNNFSKNIFQIFDPNTAINPINSYEIDLANKDVNVWDITDFHQVKSIATDFENGKIKFNDQSQNQIKKYWIFNPLLEIKSPEYISKVENQNLHSIQDLELLIVYYSEFKEEAFRLKKHREDFSKLKVEAIEISTIYNEFASGTQDPTALRDFCRMIYSRSPNFKYLLLVGDASYDYRHLDKKVNNENLVPTYQTMESFDPILGFPSDDYFGLLDDSEGNNLDGFLDISIGRIIARNLAEVKNQVDKIIQYDIAPESLGDWRLNMIFASDDEDSNAHINQTEIIADENKSKIYNLQKIYFDAYEQVSTPGGERYPEATKAINASVFQGALSMTYMGHGGPTGLAQERVLLDDDIRKWENNFRLPLLITATCSFNAFDDPSITNAGEYALHNKAGAIALFSTVRAVYSDDNFQLTKGVHSKFFEKTNGRYYTIGEILKISKNENTSGFIKFNSRKFMLFGDPSQTLAYPKYEHSIVSINDKPLGSVKDTFRALELMKVKGFVQDGQGNKLTSFNGELSATVFDKEINLKTKGNDPGSSPFQYNIQKNIIFKGSSEVKNGDWEFSFYIPKDINYEFGLGKISLYASDLKSSDAASYTDAFIIGGVSSKIINDDNPPVVKLYINDENFVNGGITNQRPKIYSKISDDLGINITGNSIGHDLTAILDANSQNPIILNNYFKSKLNDSREGEVLYPLNELSPGKHSITLTAWDISNKMGQASIEFNVLDNNIFGLDRVLNYPNPFSNHTEFQFETNLTNTEFDVTIHIQTISGKIVKTIQTKVRSEGNRIAGIPWDGKDDFGSPLGNGIYIYSVKLRAVINGETFSKTSNFQKLVKIR